MVSFVKMNSLDKRHQLCKTVAANRARRFDAKINMAPKKSETQKMFQIIVLIVVVQFAESSIIIPRDIPESKVSCYSLQMLRTDLVAARD